MKKSILLLFAALLPLVASAEKVEIDGIWYNLVPKAKQAEVTTVITGNYSGSITIPDTVSYEGKEYSVTSIGNGAFFACESLTDITIPKGVTNIGEMAFEECNNLTTVYISDIAAWCNIKFTNGSTPLFYAHNLYLNGELVTEVTIPEGVTTIGDYVFSNCSSLTAITIPKSVTIIGDYAFSSCSSLIDINIPENSQLTTIGNDAFSWCSNLTTITLPKSVTSIGDHAFSCCSSLNDINIPESVTNLGNQTFIGCSSLTTITIPEGVTTIGDYVFSNCSSLTAITIPKSVTSIGDYAFSSCSRLNDINIPENSQLTTIGNDAFSGCSSLTAITIPEGVTSIGGYAFAGCSSLTTINIPEGVTSIGESAFESCIRLTTIVLPRSVGYISYRAFANCSELTDVYCYAEAVPSTEDNAFDGSYIEYATLHVPAGAMNDYKTTALWSGFGEIIALGASITEITLSESSATLTEGEDLTLTMTTKPENADRNLISWSSSNSRVATVGNTGKVTAIAPGTATITATANDGSGVSASCEVIVTPASYVIKFLIDGEVFLMDTLTRGTAITFPEAPTMEGYTFSGWGEVPETMPANDLTISGTFIINKYVVSFKIGDEVVASESLEYGANIVAPEAPEKVGYTFNGWGEVAETVPAYDVTFEGSYSINSYTLTYVVDGEAVLTLSILYGGSIPSLKVPAKEGYTFSGWSEIPETMPANDLVIEGTFIANKYLVTFKVGDEVIAANTLEYGAAIVAPEAPEKEGRTFNGWGDVAETVPAYDVTYEGSYSINSYTLTYVVDGEAVLTLPILYGGSIPSLKVPAKEGYTFSGWSEIPETMPAENVTIEGSFTRLPSVSLTINQADNGYVKQHLTEGTVCTFTIVAAEGWKIHSVTFNGEEVTGQLTEEGTFTTPALSEDAVLNIAYEKIGDNAIDNASASRIKVQGHQGTLRITGATEGTDISVYTTDGMLVTQESAEDSETLLTLPTSEVYIVTVGHKVVKIGM